jgi:membrane-bound serine protease (ClpP class)
MVDFLLNPDVAYVTLIGGFLLAILAMLAPGTGLLEAGALILLILAGWGVYNLPTNTWALVILILGVFPFILAVRHSGNQIFLVISILALVIGSVFLFQGEGLLPAVNPVLALFMSSLTAGFFWVVVRSAIESEHARPVHDLEDLIGKTGEAKSDIDDEGTVQVMGELWTAQSDQRIPEGAAVRVTGREGFILQVEPKEGIKTKESQAKPGRDDQPAAERSAEDKETPA